MDYLEFKECVLKKINERIKEGEEVKLDKITKNNNLILDSLIIVKPGYNIFPTIYFNDFFEEYNQGNSIDEIVNEIFKISDFYTGKNNFMSNVLESFENAKKYLACKLINTKLNKDLLEKVPYREFLDLSVVVYCVLSNDDGHNSVLITNEILKEWDLGKEELLDYAFDNTPELLGEQIFPIINLFDNNENLTKEKIPLYILTNEYKYNGAICLMDNFVLEDLAQELNCDLVIIPSSIHEVLLAPKSIGPSKEILDNLIGEVNHGDLLPQDILSDHVYFYLKDEKKIVI